MSSKLKLSEGGTLRDIAMIIGTIPARKDDPPKMVTKTKRLPNAIEALDNKHYGCGALFIPGQPIKLSRVCVLGSLSINAQW